MYRDFSFRLSYQSVCSWGVQSIAMLQHQQQQKNGFFMSLVAMRGGEKMLENEQTKMRQTF
jgi:hypothetical protein